MVLKKRLLLFDVDGTLVTSPIPCTHGVLEALQEGFGLPLHDVKVSPKAATALEVAEEILLGNGVTNDVDKFKEKLQRSKEVYFRIVKAGLKDGSFYWKALPNVNELLTLLSKKNDVKLGLLTANPRSTVEMKLRSAGIEVDFFKEESKLFGAFGCEKRKRSDLLALARMRYCQFLGVPKINPNDIVVIGDTPNDVICAHMNDVPCVAVATGKYKPSSLMDADSILKNGFEDVTASVEILLNTRRSFESVLKSA